jgi:RNA polymerase sigma-70 factor (ECF subfamily)
MEFWALYSKHSTRIYNYLLWFLGSREDAEDLTSTIFLKAREEYQTLRHSERAQAWLWAITRNTALNFRRDRSKRMQTERNPAGSLSQHENGDRKIRLRLALGRLSNHDRDILILREYHGFSYAELADMLQSSIPAIKSRLFRAREKLREQYFSVEE